MAVVGSAQVMPGFPTYKFGVSGHEITIKYRVTTSDVNDGGCVVVFAPGLPELYDPYQFGNDPELPFCLCRSVIPERNGTSKTEWIVTVEYSTPPQKSGAKGDGGNSNGGDKGDKDSGDGGGTTEEDPGQFENPELAIPEIESHFENVQIPIAAVQGTWQTCSVTFNSTEVDLSNTTFMKVGDNLRIALVTKNGTKLWNSPITSIAPGVNAVITDPWPYANSITAMCIDTAFRAPSASTGEIFSPPAMMDEARHVVTITRNESILTPIQLIQIIYANAVASDVFFGYPAGTVRCVGITPQRQTKQLPDGTNLAFLRVTYLFHIKDTWITQLLDSGSYYLGEKSLSDPTLLKKKFVDWKGLPIERGLLNGTGGLLEDGANPVYLQLQPYNMIPFAPLALPQSFTDVT